MSRWQPIPGDVTGDGSVTMDDIDIIIANMGKEGAHLTTFDGDLNGDGIVDGADLIILFNAWGRCPDPTPGILPR